MKTVPATVETRRAILWAVSFHRCVIWVNKTWIEIDRQMGKLNFVLIYNSRKASEEEKFVLFSMPINRDC